MSNVQFQTSIKFSTLGFDEGGTHFIYAFGEHEIRGGIKLAYFKLD